MNQIAIREPGTRSVLIDMSDRYGMEPVAFEATLRATVVPKDCSQEQFAAFLLIAKEYKLNPILKEIYAFPAKGGGIQSIVGVDGWANLINSHPAFDGMDFEDHFGDSGELVSITCRMYRKDRTRATTATEYLAECKRATEPWTKWPRRMLRHKAMIQAARYAFSFAGIVDPDEAERFAGEFAQDVTPRAKIVPISQRIASNPEAQRLAGDNTLPPASEQEAPASPPEGASDHVSAPSTNSGSSLHSSETDTPATALPSPPTDAVAGTLSSSDGSPARDSSEPSQHVNRDLERGPSEAGGGVGGASPSPALLPQGWQLTYSAALRRAQKKESLKKYGAQFWETRPWPNEGPERETALAIFAAFNDHFGSKEQIEDLLRELV